MNLERSSLSFLFLFLVASQQYARVEGTVSCIDDGECERTLLKGSQCLDGLCTNPFHYGGCLKAMVPNDAKRKVRICHSDDPPSAIEEGHCRPSPFPYKEVRVINSGWESVTFGGWILQILLSELLNVPVSVEARGRDKVADFYDINLRLDLDGGDEEIAAFENAARAIDCRAIKKENEKEGSVYKQCSHVNPEAWAEADAERIPLFEQGIAEFVELGALAEQRWFIPKFLALKDPTLVSYAGLMGEENRKKLAETFLTPTRWKDYCDFVSVDRCATPNATALRAPLSALEDKAFFVEGQYAGFFRKTFQNDCDKNPDCTGHIADYPCFWTSFTPQITHHLNIALKSGGDDSVGGYQYAELRQILLAANATKSALIMMWWKPEALYQQFLGTDVELSHVTLPPPTQSCQNSRQEYFGRCTNDTEGHRGSPLGICDYSPQSLRKMLSSALKELSEDQSLPQELWSPAYQTVKNYRISELNIGDMLRYWLEHELDPQGYDPRIAVCRWVVENIDLIESFIPESYPRVVELQDTRTLPIFSAARALGSFVMFLSLVAIFLTYRKRKTKAVYYSQADFLYLLIWGLFLVGGASLLMTCSDEGIACTLIPWLDGIGHCLAYVPLLIRIEAINKVLSFGRQMRRVRVGKRKLLSFVFMALFLVCTYLAIWTLLDPLTRQYDYEVSDGPNENGETVVTVSTYCGSAATVWNKVNISWQLLVLFISAVLAFVAGRVKEDVNDTKVLLILIVVNLLFSTLRFALVLLQTTVDPVPARAYFSIILSCECMVTLFFFIFPKLIGKGEFQDPEGELLPDLFHRTTILYADIDGFEAWGSLREPSQVFKFLECVYSSIDSIGEKQGIFKVESVGGTYCAASGIPVQQKDHAVVLARFASDIMSMLQNLTEELEVVYGPDTGRLALRIGMASGPVTGGFLRGKGARFQLFGDTATMAREVCSSSERGSIQVTKKTAELLEQAGKAHWIRRRNDSNVLPVPTYWLSKDKVWGSIVGMALATSSISNAELLRIPGGVPMDAQKRRLIEWNVCVLRELLKQILARRAATTGKSWNISQYDELQLSTPNDKFCRAPLDEVKEVIYLPEFDCRIAKRQRDWESIAIPGIVMDELRLFVASIAELYGDHPFHNFLHASHVVLSTIKNLKRIVVPSDLEIDNEDLFVKHKTAAALHDHTYGITSDPLTQFACVFSALIHDVNHPGVPNTVLARENQSVARTFKNRSVTEQRSFTIAWNILMQAEMAELRFAICGDAEGLLRFRQLVINTVMATDLGDRELRELRNTRWTKAFDKRPEEMSDETISSFVEDQNRKATIVIEHLIQSSDVAHTMQHWDIYLSWCEKLFREVYIGYRQGRTDKNPAEFWYEGELRFFDNYIIPLSMKLHECGVFGVTIDESMGCATRNREMWCSLGKKITAEIYRKCDEDWNAGNMKDHSFERNALQGKSLSDAGAFVETNEKVKMYCENGSTPVGFHNDSISLGSEDVSGSKAGVTPSNCYDSLNEESEDSFSHH